MGCKAAFPSPSMTVYEHHLQRARQKIGPDSILELNDVKGKSVMKAGIAARESVDDDSVWGKMV